MPSEPDIPSEPLPRPPLPWVARWLMLAFSVLCLVLGLIGAVVPGMPTTVFILLSAWAAARSSPRLHGWLRRNRVFGPMLVNWERGGFVSRRAKWSATATMGVCALVILLTGQRRVGACIAIGCMAVVLGWLWRRPEG